MAKPQIPAETLRGNWSGRIGFVLAAAGSAVGLGNLWKFPYMAYENNGGAFVLIYVVAVLLVGIPIMAAEVLLGR
ncbi:MAG: sodium-dependent transporter, partial [Candidatus Competibacteraceae bacterium]